MRKVIGLKVDKHEAAHQIKHKVNIEMAPIKGDALFGAPRKREATAKLQQELLKMRDERLRLSLSRNAVSSEKPKNQYMAGHG